MPSMANVGGLLAIVLFIFSVLGMYLYPFIKQTSEGISEHSNFTSFLQSFFTLFKCSTGENWNSVQADAARTINPSFICFDISSFSDYLTYGN
jgi:hypothetical protein